MPRIKPTRVTADMETNDIIAAVTAEIGKIYPGETIHTDALPEDFERPCFAMECTATANSGVIRNGNLKRG